MAFFFLMGDFAVCRLTNVLGLLMSQKNKKSDSEYEQS